MAHLNDELAKTIFSDILNDFKLMENLGRDKRIIIFGSNLQFLQEFGSLFSQEGYKVEIDEQMSRFQEMQKRDERDFCIDLGYMIHSFFRRKWLETSEGKSEMRERTANNISIFAYGKTCKKDIKKEEKTFVVNSSLTCRMEWDYTNSSYKFIMN